MRTQRLLGLTAALLLAAAGAALGWGDETHKAITRSALTALPAEMRAFFVANGEFVAQHSIDPDYIPNRTMAQRAEHFLDLDDYGQPPFAELPHDFEAAKAKFGEETVVKRGLLPWAVQREHDRLAKALKAGDWTEARMAAAFLAHFVADTHMPLHATANYDGQTTNQRGIHFRIEDELATRYHGGTFAPPPGKVAIANPTEWTFAELNRSYALVTPLMVAEMKARQAAPLDSDQYYAEFERLAGPMLAPRIGEAAAALSALIASAWEQAGKPALPPARAVVLVREATPQDEKGATDQAILTALTARMGAWDAVALLASGAPRRLWRFSVAFRPVNDGTSTKELSTPTAGLREAVAQAASALGQFPEAAQHIVIVAAAKNVATSAQDIAKGLKGSKARVLVVVCGDAAEAETAAKAAGLRTVSAKPDVLVNVLTEAWTAETAGR